MTEKQRATSWQLEIPIQNEARLATSALRLQFIRVSGEDEKRERKRTTACSDAYVS